MANVVGSGDVNLSSLIQTADGDLVLEARL